MSQEAGPSNMRLYAFPPTLDSEIEKKKDALCVHKNLAVNVRDKYFYPSVSWGKIQILINSTFWKGSLNCWLGTKSKASGSSVINVWVTGHNLERTHYIYLLHWGREIIDRCNSLTFYGWYNLLLDLEEPNSHLGFFSILFDDRPSLLFHIHPSPHPPRYVICPFEDALHSSSEVGLVSKKIMP